MIALSLPGRLGDFGHRFQILRSHRSIYVDRSTCFTTPVHDRGLCHSHPAHGCALVKVFLQTTANLQQGIAQITAVSQTQLKQLPLGTTPPLVISYSASTVPVLELALSGQGLSGQQLNDYALNFIRTQMITVPGASVPYPYGGIQREVIVDLDLRALQSNGLSPMDVVNAISAEKLILPTTTSKIRPTQHNFHLPTASPPTTPQLNH